MRRMAPAWLAFLLLALSLLVPALINRGAFVFSDTTAYVRGADGAVVRLTGQRSPWSDRLFDRYPVAMGSAAPAGPTAAPAAAVAAPDAVVLSGRSIYYGAFLYLALLTHSFWAVAVAQAALAATALVLTVRAPGRSSGITVAALIALVALSLLSTVGYVAAFAMPDLLAALAILATAHIAARWAELSRGSRVFWILLATAAMLAHSATLMIVAALTLPLLVLRAIRCPAAAAGRAWPLLLAMLIAAGGEMAFGTAVRHATGHPPVRPPFLTARLIGDGPGFAYLQRHCGDRPRFTVCGHLHQLPLLPDFFLWSQEPGRALFKTAPPAEQRALSQEDGRFALAVARDDPWGVARVVTGNALAQLTANGLQDFDHDPASAGEIAGAIPDSLRGELLATASFRDRMPIEPATALALPLAILALAAIAWALRGEWTATHVIDRRHALALWLVAGVIANGLICGAMSGPHARYGARVIWLLPLAAIVAWEPGRRRERIGATVGERGAGALGSVPE